MDGGAREARSRVIPAPESALRSHPCGALPSAPAEVSLLPRISGCQSEDLIPLALQGGDGTQFRQGDGHAVAQGEMGAEEVVVGDEEGGEGDGAVARGKAASGADVVLVGAIEAFDELLEGAKFFRYGVEIFQADHLSQGVRRLGRGAMRVEEVQAGLISGVAVGDEAQGPVLGQGARGFPQRHGGGQSIALGSDVIGRDVMSLGIEKEKSVVVLAVDAEVGFIAGGGVAEGALVAEVEGVAGVSGRLGIVEDGLVAEGHAEDLPEDLGGLARRQGKRDVESEDEAEHVGRALQTGQVDGGTIGRGRRQLAGREVVLAILIVELELRGTELLPQLFVPVQGLELLLIMRAAERRTFIDGAVGALLPAEQGGMAVRAPVRRFRGAQVRSDLGVAVTNLAAQLRGFAAIVGVEIVAGCAAMRTTTSAGHGVDSAALDGGERSMVLALKLFAQLPPVESAGGRGRLSEGRLGIHGEVAVMRMLLAKVIARLRLRLGVGEDSLQLLDERLQILAGKFPAEPKHETWYVAHGGESLGEPGSSWHDEMGKRDFTAFLRGRQVPLTPFHRPPRDADQLNLHMWADRPQKGGRKPKSSYLPHIQIVTGKEMENL